MAWRICLVPGCPRKKLVQPWNCNSEYDWLCPPHRKMIAMQSEERRQSLKEKRKAIHGVMSGINPLSLPSSVKRGTRRVTIRH